MLALPVLVALILMRGSPHSSMKSPSDAVEHLMVVTATSVANIDALVLARILDSVLLIEDEVPRGIVNTRTIIIRHETPFSGASTWQRTYHRSPKWAMRLLTIGPLIESVTSDQPILELFVRSTRVM